VAPPKCSEASTGKVDWARAQHHLLNVSLPTSLSRQQPFPTLIQYCGPATARVREHGSSVEIRGGYCISPGSGYKYQLWLGLEPGDNAPTAPYKFFGLVVHDPRAAHAGTFTRAYASMQLAGNGFRSISQLSPFRSFGPVPGPVQGEITRGAVTIAKSMRAGTFAFRLSDATRITGSWTCGEKPLSY
jgi:hypothetical protein